MKKVKLFLMVAVATVGLASCNTEDDPTEDAPTGDNSKTVTFEDVKLDSTGILSVDGGFESCNVKFHQEIKTDYGVYSNGGFTCSNLTDQTTAGYLNQYSVYAAAGSNGSKQFCVLYHSTYGAENSRITFDSLAHVKSLQINNSTYVYLTLKDGNDGSGIAKRPCGEGDWFKVTLTGKNGVDTTGTVDYYLADFRDGKTYICDTWTNVDLSALGAVTDIYFSFDGTDQGDWGLNTPAYTCIDNLIYE